MTIIALQISSKQAQVIVILKSVAKRRKCKENKMNFEGAYLRNGLADSAQICNWRCPTLREFTQKISCVSVQGVSSYRYMKMAVSLFL